MKESHIVVGYTLFFSLCIALLSSGYILFMTIFSNNILLFKGYFSTWTFPMLLGIFIDIWFNIIQH